MSVMVVPVSRVHTPQLHTTWRHWWRRAVSWMRQAICGLAGHEMLIHFESQRMCLQCAGCGRQTPGWRLTTGQEHARSLR